MREGRRMGIYQTAKENPAEQLRQALRVSSELMRASVWSYFAGDKNPAAKRAFSCGYLVLN